MGSEKVTELLSHPMYATLDLTGNFGDWLSAKFTETSFPAHTALVLYVCRDAVSFGELPPYGQKHRHKEEKDSIKK